MVASNAIANGGLSVNNYYMINAAVPIEAYDSGQDEGADNMTEDDWKGYPVELYAANWHELFTTTGDDSKELTWKNYFSGATDVAYNFYSPGDEVVENARASETFNSGFWTFIIGDFMSGNGSGRHAWVMQEMAKGCTDVVSWFTFKCSGGWSYNNRESDFEYIGQTNPDYDPILQTEPEFIPYFNAVEASDGWDNGNGGLTRDDLAQYGFFRKFAHFEQEEGGYSYLYGPISTPVTLQNPGHQWDLLASGIPAMSFAAAVNPMIILPATRNLNMEAQRGDNQAWPTSRQGGFYGSNWLHSDIKNMALPYVFNTYDTMLELGGFTQ